MTVFLLAILIIALVLPAIVCCFLGGWFLAIGVLALCGWGLLFGLILAEFWRWYRGDWEHEESP